METNENLSETQRSVANLLFQQRKSSFEKAIDSICEEIVSTSYCNQLLTSDFRFRIIKNMESFIEIYLNSEREVFLSSLLNKISPGLFFPDESKISQKLNANPELRTMLLKFTLSPNDVSNLSTFSLSNHFFFEASTIRSFSLQIRTILFDFSHDFLTEISQFRLQMKNAVLCIVQQCHTIINAANQRKTNETDHEEVEKLNKVIEKLETSHSETEKALKSEIEQLKIHSQIENTDKSKTNDLEQEIQHQKNRNEQLVNEVLEKTEKLRTFYALKADLEDKTVELEEWKSKYAKIEQSQANGEQDSDLLRQIENLKKEKEELRQNNLTLQCENSNLKKTIGDKNSILKQSLACIEKLQLNTQNKEQEISALKEQISCSKSETNSNNGKLISLLEKQKRQIAKLNNDNDNKTRLINDLRKENEEIQNRFTKFTKIAEMQIQEANVFAQRQVEEAKQHAKAREDFALQKIGESKNSNQDKLPDNNNKSNTEGGENGRSEQLLERQPTEIEMKVIAESIKLKTANSELTTQNYILQTKIDEHATQMKRIASSYARAKEEIKETKEILAHKTNELNEMQKQIKELKIENKEKTGENQSLTQSIRKLMSQKENGNESSKRITALLDENVALDEKIKQLSSENEQQKNTINNMKIEINPLNQQVLTLKDQLTSARREIIGLQTAKREIQVRATNEQSELHDVNSKLTAKIDELQSHVDSLQQEKAKADLLLKDTMNEYEKEIREVSEKMEENRISSEKIISSLDGKNTSLENELEMERNNTKLEKMKVKEALKQIDSLSSQVKAENTKRQKQCEVIIEMKEELNDYQNEVKQISFAIFQEQSVKPLSEILQEIRRLKALLEQLTDANLQQANMNDLMKSKLKNEKDKNKTYIEKINNLKLDLKSSKQSGNDHEQSLLSKIDELQNVAQSNENQYQISLKKMQNQLNIKIQELQSNLSNETLKKEESLKKYDDARTALNLLQQDFEKSQQLIKSLQNDNENIRKEKSSLYEDLKDAKNLKKQAAEKLHSLQEKCEKSCQDTQEIIEQKASLLSIFNKVSAIINASNVDDIPEMIAKMKSDHEVSQRFLRNVHKIMTFTDEADFFVKLNILLTQQESITQVMKESGIENSRNDIASNVKELVISQQQISALKKQNKDLEQRITKMVPNSLIDDANLILSKIVRIITGEETCQLKFPMKNEVSIQLLDLIQAYQTKNDKNQKNINYIFSRAKELGFSGKNIIRAIEFLLSNPSHHNENSLCVNNI